MDVTKPYKFIWLGDIHGPKTYQFIGFRWAFISQTPVVRAGEIYTDTGPAGFRPGSAADFWLISTRTALRPPRRGAAAAGAVLPEKTHDKSKHGPRPDPDRTGVGV